MIPSSIKQFWQPAGMLEIEVGQNRTVQRLKAGFGGLDLGFASLSAHELHQVLRVVAAYREGLLVGMVNEPEKIGWRHISLCTTTERAIADLLDERKRGSI